MSEIQYADGYRDDLASGDDERHHVLSETVDEPVHEDLPSRPSQSQHHDVEQALRRSHEELEKVEHLQSKDGVGERDDGLPLVDVLEHVEGGRLVLGLELGLEVGDQSVEDQRQHEQADSQVAPEMFLLLETLDGAQVVEDDSECDDQSDDELSLLQFLRLFLDSRAEQAHEDDAQQVAGLEEGDERVVGEIDRLGHGVSANYNQNRTFGPSAFWDI